MSIANAANPWMVARNGKQSGPFHLAQLQEMSQRGELLRDDLLWSQGLPNWIAASQHPLLFRTEVNGVPMPPPLPAMPGYAQQAPRDLGQDAGMRVLLPVGRSGWAIAAGYLGLFSVLGIFGPFALICGIMALREMKRKPQLHGAGRAWFGIIMGLLGSAMIVVILIASLSR